MTKAAEGLGFVYFIEAPDLGLVKIGRGNDTKKRLSQLQVGSPVRLVMAGVIYTDDNATMERDLHRRFAGQRLHGEWFTVNDEIRSAISRLLAPEVAEQGRVKIIQAIRPQPAPLAGVMRREGESHKAMLRRFSEACARAGAPLR